MPLFGPPNIEKLKEHRNVEGLMKALGHKDADVRYRASWALEEPGDVRAVEPLIAALEDEDAEVRKRAEAALERIGGPEAERALVEYRAQQK